MYLGIPTPLSCYWHPSAECFCNLKTSSSITKNQEDNLSTSHQACQHLHCGTQGKESPGLGRLQEPQRDHCPVCTVISPRAKCLANWEEQGLLLSLLSVSPVSLSVAYAASLNPVHKTQVCTWWIFILLQLNLNSIWSPFYLKAENVILANTGKSLHLGLNTGSSEFPRPLPFPRSNIRVQGAPCRIISSR